MKIKNVRCARNTLACILAVNLLIMQYFVLPYKAEDAITIKQEKNSSLKRTLKNRR